MTSEFIKEKVYYLSPLSKKAIFFTRSRPSGDYTKQIVRAIIFTYSLILLYPIK